MFKKLSILTLALLVFSTVLPQSRALADETNLITNPSFETASGTTPQGWTDGTWATVEGDNDAKSTYLTSGHTGSRSMQISITKYVTGAGNWFQSIPVTAGQSYKFSDYYKSNVSTEVGAEFFAGDVQVGTYQKVGGNDVNASESWTQFTGAFTVPAGANRVVLFHLIAKVGYLITDDYSLTAYTPVGFNHAMISVTFDDGWKNQVSAENKNTMVVNDIKGTYYIISSASANPTEQDTEYMTPKDVIDLDAAGHEIGSHTAHHCDLTGLNTEDDAACPRPFTAADMTNEMLGSQTALSNLIHKPITNFAYPYGANSPASATEGMKYYQSLRTVGQGYNTLDNLNPTKLLMYEVDLGITVAQVKGWIDQAIAQKAWLILTYHEITLTPSPGDEFYAATPADFAAHMAYINSKRTEITPLTVAQALTAAKNQVTPTPTPPATKPGDLNGDNVVNALDLSTLLTNWNKNGMTVAQGNINGDSTIDALDLSTLLTNWSK